MDSASKRAAVKHTVRIPVSSGSAETLTVSHYTGDLTGPRVVITAGMDGDEYAGIDAAYRLMEILQHTRIHGTVTIIPVVNVSGYMNAVSFSPEDGKYPKFVFPGRSNGSYSERLTRWLYTEHVRDAELWIDLHGGSRTEKLNPFLWMFKSRNPDAFHFQKEILKRTSAPSVVRDTHPFMPYTVFLEKKRIRYVMIECGSLGRRSRTDTNRIVRWTREILHVSGTLEHTKQRGRNTPDVYSSVTYVRAPHDGYWLPGLPEHTPLGILIDTAGKKETVMKKDSGFELWRQTAAFIKKGDVLAAFAK